MRYIGNKKNLIERIASKLDKLGIQGNYFFDFFAGTANVGCFFKERGYTVFSCDLLYFSYCLQKAYIENNDEPQFKTLLNHISLKDSNLCTSPLEQVVTYLNSIEDVFGFISMNYTPLGTKNLPQPRMYFSEENGLRIDAIRQRIEEWKEQQLINEAEYYILLACLIESVSFYANVAGVYGAFYKKWDPRAVKRFTLRPIKIYNNRQANKVFHANSLELVETLHTDILYLDPPYNARQYLPNYHLIETIARYDNPTIKGISGMRSYQKEKSTFCNATTAIRDLEYIVANANYKYLILSYNSEGIMPTQLILSTLSRYGTVTLEEIEYLRFKSNNNGLSNTKRHVQEQLFILSK